MLRSDTLEALTAEDVAVLVERLGLELVVDLRRGLEAVQQGRGLLADSPVCYLNASLFEAPASDLPPREQSLASFLMHVGSPTSQVAPVVRIVCAMAGRPVLVRCAAGKDRTGRVIRAAAAAGGRGRRRDRRRLPAQRARHAECHRSPASSPPGTAAPQARLRMITVLGT